MISDLNMSNEKMSDFVSFLLLWFTLVVKLRNLDFKSHSNTLIFCWCLFFDKKRCEFRFECSMEKCFILFEKNMMLDLNMSCQTLSGLV